MPKDPKKDNKFSQMVHQKDNLNVNNNKNDKPK